MRWLALPLLASLSGGCAPTPEVADRPIVSAGLHRFDLSRFAIVGGFLDGDAILVFEELNGETRAMNVELEGGTVGLVMDMAWDPDGTHSVPMDLSRIDGQPMLHDLFGVYRGTGAGGGVLIEGSARRMRNRHGVSIREDHIGFGVGFHAGFEWIGVSEGGREYDNPLFDTANEPLIPRSESGGGCSGKVEDETQPYDGTGGGTGTGTGSPTGAPTGTPAGSPGEDDLPPLEAGGCGGPNGGCNSPPDDEPGTDPTAGTATGSTGTGTGSTGTATGTGTGTGDDGGSSGGCGDGDGCGGGSSSSSCDCGGSSSSGSCDSSSCDHAGNGRLPPLLLLLFGITARRRLGRREVGP